MLYNESWRFVIHVHKSIDEDKFATPALGFYIYDTLKAVNELTKIHETWRQADMELVCVDRNVYKRSREQGGRNERIPYQAVTSKRRVGSRTLQLLKVQPLRITVFLFHLQIA